MTKKRPTPDDLAAFSAQPNTHPTPEPEAPSAEPAVAGPRQFEVSEVAHRGAAWNWEIRPLPTERTWNSSSRESAR